MFRKQEYFKIQSNKLQTHLDDTVVSKFKELDLEEIEQSISKPLKCISNKDHVKLDRIVSTPFNNQLTTKSDEHIVSDYKFLHNTSKQVNLFPENKTRKSNILKSANSLSNYIQPINLEILLNWKLYATKSSELDINEMIAKYAKPIEIQKSIPNKYAHGHDIVPNYLSKNLRKVKIKKYNNLSEHT